MEALRPRLYRHRLQLSLRQSSTFRTVDPAVLAELEAVCDLVPLYSGEMLLRQGDPGDSLYLVVSGRIRVVRRTASRPDVVLAELGAGETVGEMALITRRTPIGGRLRHSRHPTGAPVEGGVRGGARAAPQSDVRDDGGRAGHAHQQHECGAAPPQSRCRRWPLCPTRRASHSGRLPSGSPPRWPASAPPCSSRANASTRSSAAPARHRRYDRDGGSTRLLELLAGQELEHRFVVYQSDAICSPWTERCVRQADQIVIVGDAAGDPTPGEIETEVVNRGPAAKSRRILGLLHARGALPSRTGALAPRPRHRASRPSPPRRSPRLRPRWRG